MHESLIVKLELALTSTKYVWIFGKCENGKCLFPVTRDSVTRVKVRYDNHRCSQPQILLQT